VSSRNKANSNTKGVKEIRAEMNDDFVIETVEILESQTVNETEAFAVININSVKKFA
jgi:flagellar basal body rod protein FlgG